MLHIDTAGSSLLGAVGSMHRGEAPVGEDGVKGVSLSCCV